MTISLTSFFHTLPQAGRWEDSDGLEFWNPRSGCLEEGELRNQAWVRILGLPISLWGRKGDLSPLPVVGGLAVAKAEYENCSGSTDRPSGEVRVKLMHASAREWKRWKMRSSRRSSSQRMELEAGERGRLSPQCATRSLSLLRCERRRLKEAAGGFSPHIDRPCTSGRSLKGGYQEDKLVSIPNADGQDENGNGGWNLVKVNWLDIRQGIWSGGQFSLNPRKFLVTPSWLDQFSRVLQKRLPRPTSDHFPVLLEGGGLKKRALPFQRLECNKDAALQQVELWDLVKRERSLTEEETVCKKEANEDMLSGCPWKKPIGDGGLQLKQISQQEAELLELPFSESEVLAALMDMNGDKAQDRMDSLWLFGKAVEISAGMDVELYIYNQVFSLGEWSTSWVLSKFQGLHQGDPLSPYLFVMGMEVLSALIRRAVEGGFMSGCSIRRAASGLRINLAKSEILPVGEIEEVDEMAVELG
ncbi:hypothetical protein CK203_055215 [Vitis vinifera]|uniref:DUF4283 domain-containing protein n=1 Tax=Vitis vinifera TaxID=29760 RepID=A0A438GHT5_VITVI|nr:hypothetical protein CK203_055215 [Vitis vinifera]